MTFQPDREELAWAAGFFDGEGCFSWTKDWGCVVIHQTVLAPLERFQRAVGGLGKIYGPYVQKQQDGWKRKPQWVYRAHRREHVQAVAGLVWFKLEPIKRQQALSVLGRYPKTCHRGHSRVHALAGCPQCVAGAWADKRRLRDAVPLQLEPRSTVKDRPTHAEPRPARQ